MRVLATHSIRQFPLHFPSRASPCATRFRTSSNNTAHVKLASVQVEIHGAELWPISFTENLVYYYKDICKYIRLNKHHLTSHNMNFPSNICLIQQHCLPCTNKGTYPLTCTSDGVTGVGLIPGRLHAIESSLT